MIIKGIATSPGKALGKVMIVQEIPKADPEQKRTVSKEEAISSVDSSVLELSETMKKLIDQYHTQGEHIKATLMETHYTMLRDRLFHDGIFKSIGEGYSAPAAVARSVEEQCRLLDSLGDSLIRERIDDFRDIGNQLICQIIGQNYPDLSNLKEEVILVARNLPPSLLANSNSKKIAGLLLGNGSRTSHVSILASNMGIPTVVGCGDISILENGKRIYLDAVAGQVTYNITADEIAFAKKEIEKYHDRMLKLQMFTQTAGCTADGVRVHVLGNIMDTSTTDKLIQDGADGVGLFRTEFLYMNRDKLPSEDEQFAIYKNIAEKLGSKPLTVRTMDIGGDKEVKSLSLPSEANPFLGYRAIRICLDKTDILTDQLRAALRASVYGNVKIMFPMISNMDELDRALEIFEQVKKELLHDNLPFDKNVQVGIMVEVPSVAVMANQYIQKIDFFSIGSNDLTQYTLAVDRLNEKISNLYDYFNPGVLTLIANIIHICNHAGKICSLCGEMAADKLALPLLLGFGLRNFSVNPSSILMVKNLLSMCDTNKLGVLAQKALEMESAGQVRSMVQNYLSDQYQSWL